VPWLTVVLRKGYGLGAQAMAGGHFGAQLFTVAWPTGEFGGMGIEGAVRLGMKRELEAIADEAAREAAFAQAVAAAYERGKALNMATVGELDAVIDPAETRNWVVRALTSAAPPDPGRTRRYIDTW
jgi:acetyl-CoA carboxylase carboxyltransferase component